MRYPLPTDANRTNAPRPLQHDSRAVGERVLNDDREEWRVYEVADGTGQSLVFESEKIVRRVRRFPSAWLALDEHELLALSWER
jgi:hypothetical protein